jgi:cell division protein FtsL
MKRIPLIVVMLIIGELVWSNTLVSSGRQVTQTDLAITDLRRQNEELSQKVASASALTTIFSRAKDAGFVEPTASQFVQMNAYTLPVALIVPVH